MKSKILVLLLLPLTACSTYSKKECEVKDWYQEGYNSAREGATLESINHYRKNCTAEHGVAINETLFTEGFNKGISYLCTELQGRLFGQQGRVYQGTCPKEAEEKFLKTYESGRLDFLIQRVGVLEDEVQKLQRANSSKDSEIANLRARTCH